MEPPRKSPFVPTYHKPETPGIWMNFDNTVSIYHVVQAGDDFFTAAQEVFGAVKDAQQRFPDWPRVLYLDILGHTHPRHGFDDDFIEFQQEFLFSTLAPFLTGLETPLTGPLLNPEPQCNDLPDELLIQHPGEGRNPAAG
ncbi:MAG: hypothetical protein ACE5G0_16390 [Rhodothermales bacterium]